jgi:hypothetical protein
LVGGKLSQSHISRAAKQALLIPKLEQPGRPRSLDVADQAQIVDVTCRDAVPVSLVCTDVENPTFKIDRFIKINAQPQSGLPEKGGALCPTAIRVAEHLIGTLQAQRDAMFVQSRTDAAKGIDQGTPPLAETGNH